MLYLKVGQYLLICFLRNRRHLRVFFRNYSGMILVPPAAEEKGKEARTPRAPARGLRPPAPPVWVTHLVTSVTRCFFSHNFSSDWLSPSEQWHHFSHITLRKRPTGKCR